MYKEIDVAYSDSTGFFRLHHSMGSYLLFVKHLMYHSSTKTFNQPEAGDILLEAMDHHLTEVIKGRSTKK